MAINSFGYMTILQLFHREVAQLGAPESSWFNETPFWMPLVTGQEIFLRREESVEASSKDR
jgi:hypothetical protein